jgi:uncharacterized membrane protein
MQRSLELTGIAVDVAGVAVIVVGILLATVIYLQGWLKDSKDKNLYKPFRQNIGRAILLGLEILVAGDIIRTVAVEPTFRSVGVLAIIVVIRTFLSWSLEVELEGRWPWQASREPSALSNRRES